MQMIDGEPIHTIVAHSDEFAVFAKFPAEFSDEFYDAIDEEDAVDYAKIHGGIVKKRHAYLTDWEDQ